MAPLGAEDEAYAQPPHRAGGQAWIGPLLERKTKPGLIYLLEWET